MLDALASIAPSCMFFAIGEQLNALTGLLLCLYMTWHHMENPKRDGLILMISGVIVFFLCGIACCLAHVPSLWSVIPSAPVVVLALRKMTNLPWGQLLFVVSTAAYIVAIIYYLSLAVDLAVLNEQSMNLRVGWPGMISLLIFDLIAATTLFHPFHHSFSRNIRFTFHQQEFLEGHLAFPVHFHSNCGVVHARRQRIAARHPRA